MIRRSLGEKTQHSEERFDGSFGTIPNNAALISNDKGQIISGVVVEQDITEIKKTVEKLTGE